MRDGRRRGARAGVFAVTLVGLCLVMASPGHAAGGFTYGLTVSPVPAGGQTQVLSTLGTTYDYGSVNLPDHVSVTPWFKPMDPATLPGISSCDAFLYRNGAQWGAQVVPLSPSSVPAFVVSMAPPVRWDVKIVCTYANANPVPVTLLSEGVVSPSAAAVVSPKPGASVTLSPTATPHPAVSAKPVSKVVAVPPPGAAPSSIPAAVPAPVPSAVAPAVPAPVPSAVAPAVPSASPAPRAASSSPSAASPLVDAASPVSTPASVVAAAPKAKGGGVPWVLLILVCVVVAFGGTLFIRSRGLH